MDAKSSARRAPVTFKAPSAGPPRPAAPDLGPLVALVGAWEKLSPTERCIVHDAVLELSVPLAEMATLHAMLRDEGRLS